MYVEDTATTITVLKVKPTIAILKTTDRYKQHTDSQTVRDKIRQSARPIDLAAKKRGRELEPVIGVGNSIFK